jgi:hypothetical protein
MMRLSLWGCTTIPRQPVLRDRKAERRLARSGAPGAGRGWLAAGVPLVTAAASPITRADVQVSDRGFHIPRPVRHHTFAEYILTAQ